MRKFGSRSASHGAESTTQVWKRSRLLKFNELFQLFSSTWKLFKTLHKWPNKISNSYLKIFFKKLNEEPVTVRIWERPLQFYLSRAEGSLTRLLQPALKSGGGFPARSTTESTWETQASHTLTSRQRCLKKTRPHQAAVTWFFVVFANQKITVRMHQRHL